MTSREIFLACLARAKRERPATGSATSIVTTDLMEHVGVFFPAGHRDPAAMTALAAAGHTILGFDNVMPLFSVLHESEALGCKVDWGHKGRMPVCDEPLLEDIALLPEIPSDLLDRPGCAVPLQSISLLREELGNSVAVTGKVFGPWTLGYHVYGLENFLIATLTEPEAIRAALDRLIEVTLIFGRAQLAAGADCLTLADHCTRDLCSPEAYREFLKPLHAKLKRELGCPLILHICGDTSDRIPFIAETGIDGFHFDSKVRAARACELAGNKLALMGGTSNLTTVLAGTPEEIEAEVREKLDCGIDIIGPECAVPLNAPFRNLALIAQTVKRLAAQRRIAASASSRMDGVSRRACCGNDCHWPVERPSVSTGMPSG